MYVCIYFFFFLNLFIYLFFFFISIDVQLSTKNKLSKKDGYINLLTTLFVYLGRANKVHAGLIGDA